MKPAAVVNPHAGGGAAGARWARATRDLGAHLEKVEVRFTRERGDGITLARELAEAGFDPIIAAGGDGTVNEVANGILHSGCDAALGVLPLASGGDFARGLGLGRWSRALLALRSGKWRRIDVVKARFAGTSGQVERYFVNVASMGLGGEVAEAVGRSTRRLPGTLQYLVAAVPRLAAGESFPLQLSVDGAAAGSFDVTLAALGNGQYQGGGIRIAPAASIDDGLLEITVVQRIGLAEVLRNIHLLYWGDVRTHARVRSWRAKQVRVEAPGVVPVELDGEALGRLPLDAEVVPGALRLICRLP